MRYKTILIIFLLQFPVNAFAQLGGTLDLTGAWSTHIETPGINARAYFFANDKICFGPEFTYFFEKVEDEQTVNAFTIDFNAHYVFEVIEHRLGMYPIVGTNFTHEKATEMIMGEDDIHFTKAFGLNLGAGIEVPLTRQFNLFSEYLHTFGSLEDTVLYLGFNYVWEYKKGAKHESEH